LEPPALIAQAGTIKYSKDARSRPNKRDALCNSLN
jgi:hypothetical protein